MTPKKYKKILAEMFENLQSKMALELDISPSKVSHLMTGRQNLPAEKIGILLTRFNLDTNWFFNASDDEPIRLQSNDIGVKMKEKYYNVLEENAELLREKAEWYQKRDSEKKSSEIS
ncbi:MAG: hypothetical protein NXI00_11135 [Cytophagales bacterium]|nr:hypothetical protein [Cytophagales bacterium]